LTSDDGTFRRVGLGLLWDGGYVNEELLFCPARSDHGKPSRSIRPAGDYAISWYTTVPLYKGTGWPAGASWTDNDYAPTLDDLQRYWPRYPVGGGVQKGMNILLADVRNQYLTYGGNPVLREEPHDGGAAATRLDGSAFTLPDYAWAGGALSGAIYNGRPDQGVHHRWWGFAHEESKR
ncbi:MAG: hypothetical protein ACYTGH_18210, partial [Planctomycetota bacterium]